LEFSSLKLKDCILIEVLRGRAALSAKRYVAFIVFKAEGRVSEQEIKDILPLDNLAGKGLERLRATVC